MRKIELGRSGMKVPTVAVGCMRLYSLSKKESETMVKSALELGANFFDHADIYGNGVCEEIFAEACSMSPSVRETMILQSKCGIRPGVSYDFSKSHILSSVDAILSRLKTDYLDVLLLHRPDALCDPEEVAEAFGRLRESGKVRHFGVSNQNPMQIQLLQKFLPFPLVANQLQFSIMHASMISQGLHVNMSDDPAAMRDGSVLDYCRLNDITIQPWSPLQHGFFGGPFLDKEKFPKLNAAVDEVAAAHSVSDTTVALAWILRHPARMQPVTGTTNPKRLEDCLRAADVELSREEWYKIYLAAGNNLP